MKQLFRCSLALALFCLPIFLNAQPGFYIANDDSYTFIVGQFNPSQNVTLNDTIAFPTDYAVDLIKGDSSCFRLTSNGDLLFFGGQDCCGTHVLEYVYLNCQEIKCRAFIFVNVLCKPDCYFVNMEDPQFGQAGDFKCAQACEFSESTYYVPFDPANSYTWLVGGGTFVPGADPAEIVITWGPAGTGTVTVLITDSNNITRQIDICVDIQQSPVAGFSAPDSVCLETAVSFSNTSTGGSSSFWDFGDGQTSTDFSPTHTYAAPGTYTVCLTVTRQNVDLQGNPLCCCTDVYCQEVVVDPLQGPDIFCISTLCAFNSTEYWTDAANCGTYYWEVHDADGNPLPFGGQGTDRISVQWGDGPVGTVSLFVSGCDDLYCEDTVSVEVPIISATTEILGPKIVCQFSTETYSVQKWLSAEYLWTITNGTILSDPTKHSVIVRWNGTGTGTLNVSYSSDFLSGLPGHDPVNCSGSASFTVDIRPKFAVDGPTPPIVCLNDITTFTAFPTSSNFNWTVTPPAPFTGQGTSSIDVDWSATGTGTYQIVAEPLDPTEFCNERASISVEVISLPKPLDIDGPVDICPGETYTYFGQTSETGVGFDWVVLGGVPVSGDGYSITVTWDAAGPYSLTLSQKRLSDPMCVSDPIQLTVNAKTINTPIILSSTDPSCINKLGSYSVTPPQHPDATYYWSVSPDHLGSVVSGQGTPAVDIQWNNDIGIATVSVEVSLCGTTITANSMIPVVGPTPPTIMQPTTVCSGQPFTLDAGAGYCNYSWSNGDMGQVINVTAAGVYTVTATDCDGCVSTASITAVNLPDPPADLPGLVPLCINPPVPADVTLTTPGGQAQYDWTCNGAVVSPPTPNMFVHTNTNVPGNFLYAVTVTGANGCTAVATSLVVQDLCPPCVPEPFTLAFAATPQSPNCNTIDFNVTAQINVLLDSWDFNDPNNQAPGGPVPSISHTYSVADCYPVVLYGLVPNSIGPGFCLVTATETVCVDLAPDFDYSDNCGTVTFSDLSTVLSGQPAISGWTWNFGDGSPASNAQNPVHIYTAPGTYNVTLEVTNGTCVTSITLPVQAGGVAKPAIAANPMPYCVDKPINFTATAAGAESWLWDFGDGASNANQNVSHTYVAAGPQTVTMTVTNSEGCTNMNTLMFTVNPLPPDGVISAAPGLTVCAGTSVTLTALAPGGPYTYEWSTFETTQSIVVLIPGTYSVTLTDANGCTTVPDPVTVVHIPLPSATISGNAYICDADCKFLRAPLGNNYSYQWFDSGGPIATGVTSMLQVCSPGLTPPYQVEVTDNNTMCVNLSAPFDVQPATSPVFTVDISPDDCEGIPIDLKVNPVDPDVKYSWSNGDTGPSTVVTQAGTYIAVGVHQVTGCSGIGTAVIHPLPDLCLVPVGCYEVCNPDTICGPDGLASYQWNRNGVPIPGETGQCLIVTQSGNYSLTGTTDFGCVKTSDTLKLEVLDCNCDGLEISAAPAGNGDCCWKLSYTNPYNNKYGLAIICNDADLTPLAGSLDPALQITVAPPPFIGIESSTVGMPLPSGTLTDFLTICPSNILGNPIEIIFEWYELVDSNGVVVCSDTLELFTQASRTDTVKLCPSETITIGGTPYTAPAVVAAIAPGMNGDCDTLVTYILVLKTPAPSVVTINCPPSINLTISAGATDTTVMYQFPTATTTCVCPGVEVEQTSGLPSGSKFPVGTTTNCFLARDSCGNTATCCFTVTVTQTPSSVCDVKQIGCIRYELLSITQNPAQEKTYRIRVTNLCPNKLIYTAIGIPDGITAVAPANNSVYTAPSGRQYEVRNPNFSPFYSVRFKSTADSIASGQSDIFQITLPEQADIDYFHVTSRVSVKVFYEAYLNTFNCPIGVTPKPGKKAALDFQVFPNPTDGLLYANLSEWTGATVHLRVLNANGQRVLDQVLTADAAPQLVPLPPELAGGLYTVEVWTASGERRAARFLLVR